MLEIFSFFKNFGHHAETSQSKELRMNTLNMPTDIYFCHRAEVVVNDVIQNSLNISVPSDLIYFSKL